MASTGFVVGGPDDVLLPLRPGNFVVGEPNMTPIRLDVTHLLGFDRQTVVSAKIGVPKKHGAKVGPVKKSQSAKIGISKVRAK